VAQFLFAGDVQAKVMNCVEMMMKQPNPTLYFGYEGKIKVSKRFSIKDNESPTGIPFNQPWLKLGSGKESVYAIFSGTTMNKYVDAGLKKYPIKIGRTNRRIEERIQELQTGSYFDLRIGIQISSDNSRDLEARIHNRLEHMRVTSRNTSSEWFYSSLREIRDIYLNEIVSKNIEKFI
jgi:hypothetical protein